MAGPVLLLVLAGLLCGASAEVNFELDKVPPQCLGEPWPLPQEVPPTVVTLDTGQSYGDQGRGIAFIYHPCAHPRLQRQLTLLARACVPRPILAPALGLTRERALATALTLQPWRLPGREAVRAPPISASMEQPAPPGARRRPPRNAQEATPSPADSLGKTANATAVTEAPGPARPTAQRGDALQAEEGEGGSNGSRAQLLGPGSRAGCVCPEKAPPAFQVAVAPTPAPAQRARGSTPRTEEAAWAATALTFLLVVLTLAVLCARLHRNFRRGHSLYWEPGPALDGQDTVAAVLKRRMLSGPGRHKRWRRSRQRPLLSSTTDGDSSDD
ncbi:tumor protein p53-inducible protein 13 isoform X4 [Ornithorhynchus anatinus]|uniref:tumor protein p53-inducible protein 13 isoform X4 n=1 Tax=Ornithorhynchus anatinus TaxID=9258 RepID=UPI0010A8492D|nr:tumor protein p53-inducible protein 13 isoform X4 [Ornithorhynchus anatinus]